MMDFNCVLMKIQMKFENDVGQPVRVKINLNERATKAAKLLGPTTSSPFVDYLYLNDTSMYHIFSLPQYNIGNQICIPVPTFLGMLVRGVFTTREWYHNGSSVHNFLEKHCCGSESVLMVTEFIKDIHRENIRRTDQDSTGRWRHCLSN